MAVFFVGFGVLVSPSQSVLSLTDGDDDDDDDGDEKSGGRVTKINADTDGANNSKVRKGKEGEDRQSRNEGKV